MKSCDRHHLGELKRFVFNLHHFAGDNLLSNEERAAGRSGATFQGLDAVGRKVIPARRVCFWRRFAALHRLTDAPHRSARCALPNGTPKTNIMEQIKHKTL
ncbi:MAG: hypothetical protein CMO03_13775 [Thalassospira sp.]|jgi:hypothetical protein|nr:hypothetical protein [Thalassospira sp.]